MILVRQDCLNGIEGTQIIPSLPMLQLVTAAGTSILIVDYIEATVKIDNKEVRHKFIVVDSLITSAILWIDFMKKHRITLDFNTMPVGVFFNDPNSDSEVEIPSEVQQMWSTGQVEKSKAWTAALLEPATQHSTLQHRSVEQDLPESREKSIRDLIQEYRDLFPTTPGKTTRHSTSLPPLALQLVSLLVRFQFTIGNKLKPKFMKRALNAGVIKINLST